MGQDANLIRIDGLSEATLRALMTRAEAFIKGAPAANIPKDACVSTLFFEPSTRTKLSFQRAAQRLGVDMLSFDVANSSTRKGETALDTFRNIEAMGVDVFVVRHHEDGAVDALVAHANKGTRFVNAGDGRSNHPTQALLDMMTLQQNKGQDFTQLRVAIVGDVKHSRVARSDYQALALLGVQDIRVCGPTQLLPAADDMPRAQLMDRLDDALDGVDVVMTLRLQRERMEEGLVDSLENYHANFGISEARLARAAADAIVMHPGPMNRGVEIEDAVADGPQSRILQQVRNGVYARAAVLERALRGTCD
ncbi:aspartate carbamoyltransferase catalytic subunit [Lysobacter sp. HDW10]|uniref:aspartate carbamoyltransferase catalytic subunit n=1 Tax=Lysobacter sp. HDW10 TaxID=2714936 RepID=UPI00140D37B1|nr:aspartate carbamoyltransferase catalytic subunit [Lysobacter sp. HDW10]QIK81161.1 aspartate carbamoyltransferase catalytic subunit [Lysobacter sp. HDW10]